MDYLPASPATTARSTFAAALHELLDATGFYNRAQWARFLRVSTPAISQWVNDRTLPRADLLGMVVDLLRTRGGPAAQQSLHRFDQMAQLDAAEVSPFGARLKPNVAAYLRDASMARVGEQMRELGAAEQQAVLSGSWRRRGQPASGEVVYGRTLSAPAGLGHAVPVATLAHVAAGLDPDLQPRLARLLRNGKEQSCDLEAALMTARHAIIVAGPGAGKTSTLAMLASVYVRQHGIDPDAVSAISLCDGATWWMEVPHHGAQTHGSDTLTLVDGFDEVPTADRRRVAEIIVGMSARPGHKIVVASRPVSELSAFQDFERFSLGGLSQMQLVRTVMRSLDEHPLRTQSLLEAKRFLCHYSEKKALQSTLREPLYLSNALRLFRSHAVTPFSETHVLGECIRGIYKRDDDAASVRCREPWSSGERLSELAGEVSYKSLLARMPTFGTRDVANWIGAKYPTIDPHRLAWALAEQGMVEARDDAFTFSKEVVRDYVAAAHVVKGGDGALAYLGEWKARPDLCRVLRMACSITSDATALLYGILAAVDAPDPVRFGLLAEILAQPIAADPGALAECCYALVDWLDGELREWSVCRVVEEDQGDTEVFWRLAATGRPIGSAQSTVRQVLSAVHRARSGSTCGLLKDQFEAARSPVLPAFAECLDVEGRLDLQFIPGGRGEGLAASVSDLMLN